MKKWYCHACKRLRLSKFLEKDQYDKTRYKCKDRFSDGSSCDRVSYQNILQAQIDSDPWYGW